MSSPFGKTTKNLLMKEDEYDGKTKELERKENSFDKVFVNYFLLFNLSYDLCFFGFLRFSINLVNAEICCREVETDENVYNRIRSKIHQRYQVFTFSIRTKLKKFLLDECCFNT